MSSRYYTSCITHRHSHAHSHTRSHTRALTSLSTPACARLPVTQMMKGALLQTLAGFLAPGPTPFVISVLSALCISLSHSLAPPPPHPPLNSHRLCRTSFSVLVRSSFLNESMDSLIMSTSTRANL